MPSKTESETFFVRWSERKSAGVDDAVGREEPGEKGVSSAPVTIEEEPGSTPGPESEADLAECETLEFSSDFSRYVRTGIGDALQQAALRRLWLTSPLFGASDGLDVYRGDYTCSAPQPDGAEAAASDTIRNAVEASLGQSAAVEDSVPVERGAGSDSLPSGSLPPASNLKSGNVSTAAGFRSRGEPEESGRG